MGLPRSTIFLGDFVHALNTLQPADVTTRDAIADLLGMQVNMPRPVSSLPLPHTSPIPAPSQMLPSVASKPFQTPQPSPASITVPSVLERSASLTVPTPSGILPLPDETSDAMIDLQREPLFLPNWRRGILSAAFATYSGDGPPDIARLIQALARVERIDQIPRQLWPTMRRGIQLLVDCSEALTPFSADQAELQDAIIRLVGPDKIQILSFAGMPLRGAGTGPQIDWRIYQPPPRGTPVVLLTDLGIGRPMFSNERAEPAEWFTFATELRWVGCPVVAFVPYAPRRWPAELTRVMTIIPWDRSTTASTVRYLVGHACEV